MQTFDEAIVTEKAATAQTFDEAIVTEKATLQTFDGAIVTDKPPPYRPSTEPW